MTRTLLGTVSCIQALTSFAPSPPQLLNLARLKPAQDMATLAVISPRSLSGAAIIWRCHAPAATAAQMLRVWGGAAWRPLEPEVEESRGFCPALQPPEAVHENKMEGTM